MLRLRQVNFIVKEHCVTPGRTALTARFTPPSFYATTLMQVIGYSPCQMLNGNACMRLKFVGIAIPE